MIEQEIAEIIQSVQAKIQENEFRILRMERTSKENGRKLLIKTDIVSL